MKNIEEFLLVSASQIFQVGLKFLRQKLYTVDNPGWRLQVELVGTKLENLNIERESYEISETDWYTFIIKDKKFDAAGDPSKLEILIENFKRIVDQQD
ncbi:MAG: hypothetical protein IPP74_07130 [Alphaproteobacteria bacterium]|nr:hypothetical protein [Alphaproteobacteria bacterium]